MGIELNKVLVVHCHTSGINGKSTYSENDFSIAEGYQPVSIALIVADVETYEVIDEMYVEIKWNGVSKWDAGAEKIHGLSKEYLEEHGEIEEDALVDVMEFIMNNMDIKKPLYCMGNNITTLHLPFLRDLFKRYELSGIRFGIRNFDTFSLSMGTINKFDQDSVLSKLGIKKGKKSNELARNALTTYKRINKAWNLMLKKNSNG